MITIISATNRPDSRTELVANKVFELIGKYTDEEVNQINLSTLDPGFVHPMMYNPEFLHPDLVKLQDTQLIPADKWIIISPEYNGSYSGMGKLFIDAVSVRMKNETFGGKKLGLIGVASGRAGNLRGLDHLTTALNYMGMVVFPQRLPLSQIMNHINNDELTPDIDGIIDTYLDGFTKF